MWRERNGCYDSLVFYVGAYFVALLVAAHKFEPQVKVWLFMDTSLMLTLSDYSSTPVATSIISSYGHLVWFYRYGVEVPTGSLWIGP